MHVFGVVWSTCGPVRWTPPAPYNCIIGQLLLNYTHARLWCGAVYLRASAVNPEDFHHGRQEVRGAATRRTTLRSAQTETKTDLQGASDQSACNQKPKRMRRAHRILTTLRSVGVQSETQTDAQGATNVDDRPISRRATRKRNRAHRMLHRVSSHDGIPGLAGRALHDRRP